MFLEQMETKKIVMRIKYTGQSHGKLLIESLSYFISIVGLEYDTEITYL